MLDSYRADSEAYLQVVRSLEIPLDLKHYERHYSPNTYRMHRAAGIPRARWKEIDKLWRRSYLSGEVALIPGARSVLRWLHRRFVLALVTSGNRSVVTGQLRQFGLINFFAARVCSEDAPRRKPSPAPLLTAIRRLRVRPTECLYVGDTAEDVEMAHRAGVRVVGVLGPFPTHARLRSSRPDALIASVREIPNLLKT